MTFDIRDPFAFLRMVAPVATVMYRNDALGWPAIVPPDPISTADAVTPRYSAPSSFVSNRLVDIGVAASGRLCDQPRLLLRRAHDGLASHPPVAAAQQMDPRPFSPREGVIAIY